jgi:prevent-host-death family protein
MHTVNMHEAKSNLSKLVEEALAGEEVVIARAGNPVVRLLPIQRDTRPREPGRLKGQVRIAPDFDATPEEVIRTFEGDTP